MSGCCDVAGDRRNPTSVRRAREILAWAAPGVLLVSVPKCPVCLAAYATLWTGLGVSFSAATYLRWGLLSLCVASWLLLILGRLHRSGTNYRHSSKETEQ